VLVGVALLTRGAALRDRRADDREYDDSDRRDVEHPEPVPGVGVDDQLRELSRHQRFACERR
jgi:hypothetical protein